MDIRDIIEDLDKEDIVSLMEHLGSELSNKSNDKELIFTSICHNSNSFKLYYYIESKNFYCWSNCKNIGSVIDLLIHINKYEAKDAIEELKTFFNISNISTLRRGFRVKKKYKKLTLDDIELELLPTPTKPFLYTVNKQIRIPEWEKENINFSTIKKFDIRVNEYDHTIIIPHFCWKDNRRIVGVRVRNLDEEKIDKFGKYCPMYLENQIYSHQLGKNLYGLNFTKDNIKRTKKVVIGEGEKFVLQFNTLFPKENISVATCGSALSKFQSKILLELGIEELIWAFDKQYSTELEEKIWLEKITSMSQELINYGVKVTAIWDSLDNGLLDHKESPLDKTKEIYLKLVKNRRIIKGEEIDDKL